MSLSTELRAAVRLDFGEVVRSRWLPFSTVVYALIAGALVIVGARESTVLGFTGMSRVMLSFAHVLLVILPLLALTATTQVINRARDDGTIELLFSHPVSRSGYLGAVTLTRLTVLIVPLWALLFAMVVLGRLVFHDDVAWGIAARAGIVSTALLFAYTGLGLAVSCHTRNQAKAVVVGLLIWGASVALVDLAIIGLMLEVRLEPHVVFAIAATNPVQAARIALLEGIEPDLATLGPVGFYLRHHLPSGALVTLGVGWPMIVGAISWLYALRRFRRGDLV